MLNEILKILSAQSNPANVEGMKRYKVTTLKAFGVTIPVLRALAKKYKHNHKLALELWETGIHEARVMAFLIDNPKEVTIKQMEKWVKDFDSWAVCDGTISVLFDKTPFAYQKAIEWSKRKDEFTKRAGFTMMATLSVHDKKADDEIFLEFLPLIEKESTDERNFVKKAVNWALRTIGKRSWFLYKEAVECAERIKKIESKSAKWIASDAMREFKTETTLRMLNRRNK